MEDKYITYLENKAHKHLVIDSSGKVPIDHADEIKKADYFVGSNLVAKKTINILSRPIDGKVLKIVSPGAKVGTIFSYYDNTPDGSVWWQLSGTNGVGGFVKHEKGAFDTNTALQTASGKEHEENLAHIDEMVKDSGLGLSGFGDALQGFGKNLNMIIIGVLLLACVVAMYKLFKL